VASSEAEFPPSRGPAEGTVEGVSGEAELDYSLRVGLLLSSEAEMWCTVEGLGGEASSEAEIAQRVRGGLQMGRTAELGRGPCVDWASLGPGEDLGAADGLEELHGIRMQSDDGVAIIGGFFLSRITVE